MAVREKVQGNDIKADSTTRQLDTSLHHDHVDEEAIGGHTADLGASYYRSVNFVGTVLVSLHKKLGCTLSLTEERQPV
jgi:hypothetical protein